MVCLGRGVRSIGSEPAAPTEGDHYDIQSKQEGGEIEATVNKERNRNRVDNEPIEPVFEYSLGNHPGRE